MSNCEKVKLCFGIMLYYLARPFKKINKLVWKVLIEIIALIAFFGTFFFVAATICAG